MALHLYGVAPEDVPPPSRPGRGGAPVRTVTGDGLAVIVSDIDPEAPAGPKDLLAHAHVLEEAVERGTVVPMQFGIALPDEDAVRAQLLDREGDELRDLLATFDGTVQVTVQAFHHEEPALREVLRREPRLQHEREELRAARVQDQGRQVALGQAVADLLEYLQEEDHELLLTVLEPYALAIADNERNGVHQVLNAAFLVQRERQSTFDQAVASLGDETAERLRLRYVGPQPPYAFLDAARAGELAWG